MALHRERTSKTNGHITVRPREITKLEGKELFERKVRKATGLSTEAFIEKWENGELPDTSENARLAILIPFGR